MSAENRLLLDNSWTLAADSELPFGAVNKTPAATENTPTGWTENLLKIIGARKIFRQTRSFPILCRHP